MNTDNPNSFGSIYLHLMRCILSNQEDIIHRLSSLNRVHVDFGRQVIEQINTLTADHSTFRSRVDESMGLIVMAIAANRKIRSNVTAETSSTTLT